MVLLHAAIVTWVGPVYDERSRRQAQYQFIDYRVMLPIPEGKPSRLAVCWQRVTCSRGLLTLAGSGVCKYVFARPPEGLGFKKLRHLVVIRLVRKMVWCMYVCVCVCVWCVCVWACACMCMCVCVRMSICMCMCLCLRVCMCICMCRCMCAPTCSVCIHMCVCVCVCVYACVCPCLERGVALSVLVSFSQRRISYNELFKQWIYNAQQTKTKAHRGNV